MKRCWVCGLRLVHFPSSSQTHWQPKYCTPLCVITLVTPRIKEVFDLYSGTGTIAQLLASVAKEVIGVEIVEEAVEAAKVNAALNGLTNCRFIAGDVLKVLDDLTEKPDMIILDPPRDGIHPKALPKILAYGVGKHRLYLLQTNKSCKRFTCISGSWL